MAPEEMGRWRERLKDTASDTTLSVLSERVPPKERWYVQRVAARTDSQSNATLEVGIETGGYFHVLYFFDYFFPGEWDSEPIEVWLFEGEYLRFDWSSIVSGDVVEAHITGVKRLE
jgi:hypothetical protein